MASLDELLQQLGFGGVTRNRAGQIVGNTNDVIPVATAGLADTLYGAGRGTLAGTAAIGGIPGDINQMYVNKFGALYPNEPAPPTSEQISQAVKRAVPPLNLSKDNTGRVATSLGENVVSPMVAPESLLSAGTKTAKYAAPVIGDAAEQYAVKTGLLAPLVAYHGSPAKFEKFDISKMGTGEGQQVYGRGMYFAENPKVAEGYRARLAGGNDPYTYEWQGNKYELGEEKDPVRHAVALSYHQGTSTAKRIAKMGLADAKKGEMYALENGGEEYYKKMLEAASNIKKKDIKAKQGAFYTVDIPDESVATFMDWDKPLSKQNDFVKKIISSHPDVLDYIKQQEQQRVRLNASSPIRLEKIPSASVPFDENTMTGKDVLTAINQRSGLGKDGFAEQELQKLGIEGIRYKDAGSRTTKGGTNNFVVFDPSKVKILKRE